MPGNKNYLIIQRVINKKWGRIPFVIALAIFGWTAHAAFIGIARVAPPWARGYCYEAEVTDVSGTKYFPAVKEALSKAEKSINLVMFVIELSAYKKKLKADQLIDVLIEAKQRGVNVEVILDQNVDFVQRRSASDWEAKIKSIRAYKRLRDAGIKVYYDEPARYTHAKTIIIDKSIAIVGSTNWTESAFSKNNEVNVLIRSKGLAEEILSYIKTIKIDENIEEYLDFIGPATPISWEFMDNLALAVGMVRAHDERAFDVYLFLLKEFNGRPATDALAGATGAKLTLSYEVLAKYLGIYDGWTDVAYKRQIVKVLRKLERRYKLIKVETGDGKEATVVMIDSSPEFTLREAHVALRDDGGFGLPDEYFNFGWNRILSFRAKFCYLLNLAYADISDTRPFWSKSIATIIKQLGGIDQGVIIFGMEELRRKRLIEVSYDTLTDKPYDERLPKMYKILKLYDPKELKSRLMDVEIKYGKAAYTKAKKYAEIVFEENNPEVIADIILKTIQYGEEKVKKAFDIIALKKIDNPKRTYNYAVGVIEGMQ